MAARYSGDEVMQLLLGHKELKKAAGLTDKSGRNVLFACIANHEAKNEQKVKWMENLVLAGAGVTLEDDMGWTPLIYACVYGTEEMVELLVQNGAEVNKLPGDGWAALHTVVS